MGRKGRSPDGHRSDSKNSNNPAYQEAVDNRANQLNPEQKACRSSRKSEADDSDDE